MSLQGFSRPGRWLVAGIGVALCPVIVLALACVNGDGAPALTESSLSADHIEIFKSEGVRWIRWQRDLHYPEAEPLSLEEKRWFAPYFSKRLLGQARVRVVDRFENPGFFSLFDEAGEPYPIDLRRASGLALIDTILIARRASRESSRRRLLFHELVHLVQYDALGLERYMDLYVGGWQAHGERYRAIPQERQAYDLTERFGDPEAAPFSVEEEVRAAFPPLR